jgi:uncharacterized protein (DUF1778 family)
MKEREIIIATLRGTERERAGLHAAAAREGLSVNKFVRQRLGMRVNEDQRKKKEHTNATA